ncbi:hypothetical protein HZA38_00725 [Candidatus Peregrinibacteria bacterium]|nr:hypothetical protein [Candidatus Peregrinibacteria bacterium]
MLIKYLKKIGFTEKEQELYLVLAEIGIQPASVVAKKCNMDRVTAYKNLKHLTEKGFLRIYYRSGIQCFGIQSFDSIRMHLKEKYGLYEDLLKEFPLVEKMMKSLQGERELIPELEIFEGEAGIKRFFRDLLFEVKSEKLHQIKMLTSNTFEERLGNVPLSRFIEEFFNEIKSLMVDFEILEMTGTLLPERLHRIAFLEFNPEKIPAAKGTTSIFIAGHAVYLTCYKTSQIGLKIKQSEISQMFHFLFDMLKKKI